MKYVQKKYPKELFINVFLSNMLESINTKLSQMEELSISEGNQNWKKSKLAIILLTMKKIIMQIADSYSKKPKNPVLRKIWYQKIKILLRQLKITTKLANNEMQKQREKVLSNEKEKILSPFEFVLLNQLQNIR